MHAHRRAAPVLAALVTASLLLTGCQNDQPGTATSTPTTTTTQPALAPSASTSTPSGGQGGHSASPQVIADGRWPGYVTAVTGRTMTFDLVKFLTGDEAIAEWQKRYPDSEDETPPNDYVIVNDSQRMRTLPFGSHPSVKVCDNGSATPDTEVGTTGLRNYLHHTLFWITVSNGHVTQLKQQFLP